MDVIDIRDYSSVVNQPEICSNGDNSVLAQFRLNSALSGTSGSTTGQSHLFFGKSTNGYNCIGGGCSIGCAYLDGTCQNYGYGVNYMMYELDFSAPAPTLYKQSLLFTHEAGHTA